MSNHSSSRHWPDRGSAIISVLLLVFLLLISITGAFMRTSTERRHALDASAEVDAYALAQAGIDRYLVAVPDIPLTLPDSQVFPMTGGRAVVTLRLVVRNADDTVFAIVSRGENFTNRSSSTTPRAVRTVMQLLTYAGTTIELPAAFSSLSGIDKTGVSGSLSGVDACHTAPAPLADIAGAAVPSISATNPAPNFTGPTSPIDGDPEDAAIVLGTPGTTGTAKDAIHIDWVSIKARTVLNPTYYYKTSTPTAGSWPTNSQINGANWPTVFVEGNLNLPSDGQGLLIVTGNLTMNGSEQWSGLVLVGGTMISNGNNTILGAMLTALNVKSGGVVPPWTIAHGNKTFQYNSCFVKKALFDYAGWRRMGNAWADNFPSY
jgi:hypothetical protein